MTASGTVASRAEWALRGDADSVTVIQGGPHAVHVDVRQGGQSSQAWHTSYPHTQVTRILLPGAPLIQLSAPDALDLFTWGLHSPETRWQTLINAADRWPGALDLLCGLLSVCLQDTYGGRETGRYIRDHFAQLRREVLTPAGPADIVCTAEWSGGRHLWTADHRDWTFEVRSLDELRQQLQVHFNAA